MLVLLTVEDVGTYWEFIKEGLVKSKIPLVNAENVEIYPNILASLLEGSLVAFMEIDGNSLETGEFKGVIVAGIITDAFSLTKNLIIYAFWSVYGMGEYTWIEALGTLRDYAKCNGCTWIFGYSDVPKMVELAKSLGADGDQRLLKVRV